MNYYNYSELKDLIVVNKEYQEKFREQTDLERRNLKEDLIFYKRILNPLQVRTSINGLVLVDGHHRWELLPEVIKECPEFDLNIPVITVKLDDVPDVMLRTQLGRRNLSPEDIKQYVDTLITEDGFSANRAYKKVAEITGKSKSAIQRIHKEELAEKDRQYHKENNVNERIRVSAKKLPDSGKISPETIETSLQEKERKLEQSRQRRLNKKMEGISTSPNYYKEFEGNLLDSKQLVEYEDKPYYDEVLANGSRYRNYTNQEDYLGTEEYISGTPTNPNNPHTNIPEYERLRHIEDKIKDLKDHLPYFQDSSVHQSMKTFIDNFYSTLNKVSK